MREYECVCMVCGAHRQITFPSEPYPAPGEEFSFFCKVCSAETRFTRALTRKALAEQRRIDEERLLREQLTSACTAHGFTCRFVFRSVCVKTPLAEWFFDYHTSRITLYHESTRKINFQTGDYAKSHCQFRNRRMSPVEVIEYIAGHDLRNANPSAHPTTGDNK